MNNHLNPIFRDALNGFAPSRECNECKVLASVGHAPRCSQYVQPAPINWSADGFVRTERGHIAGFAVSNEPRYAAIGNGLTGPLYGDLSLFVRVGTGRKNRRAA